MSNTRYPARAISAALRAVDKGEPPAAVLAGRVIHTKAYLSYYHDKTPGHSRGGVPVGARVEVAPEGHCGRWRGRVVSHMHGTDTGAYWHLSWVECDDPGDFAGYRRPGQVVMVAAKRLRVLDSPVDDLNTRPITISGRALDDYRHLDLSACHAPHRMDHVVGYVGVWTIAADTSTTNPAVAFAIEGATGYARAVELKHALRRDGEHWSIGSLYGCGCRA